MTELQSLMKRGNKNPMYGRYHTKNTKRIQSEIKKGNKNPMRREEVKEKHLVACNTELFKKFHRENFLGNKNPLKKEIFKQNHIKAINSESCRKKRAEKWTTKRRKEAGKRFSGNKNPMKQEDAKRKLRLSIIEYIKTTCGGVVPFIGKYEKQILDKLENMLGIKILRNYYIKELGYWVDGYYKEFNIVIEVDEEHHYKNNTLREKDLERQNNIMKTLQCIFIRIRTNEVIKNNEIDLNNLKKNIPLCINLISKTS